MSTMPSSSHSSETQPMPDGPVSSGAAWYGADIENSDDWIVRLTPDDLDELDGALRVSVDRGDDILDIDAGSFPLPALSSKLHAIREEVMSGRGIALLRGLPVDRYSMEEIGRMLFGIGRHMGTLRSQNAKGHLLGHVCDIGHDHHHNAYQRGYAAAGPLSFHTDSVDIVALMCLQPAMKGGDSKVVSSVTVHNEVWKRRPDLAPLMFEPVYRDRRGEIPDGKDPWWIMPVYQWHKDDLFSHYSSVYIRSAQRFREAKRLTDAQIELFELIETISNEPGLYLRMPFQAGDVQFVNNHHMFHARDSYEDWPEQGRRRHLLRLWICPPAGPPLPQAYEERYGDISIGNRGGIIVPGSDLTVPLTPA